MAKQRTVLQFGMDFPKGVDLGEFADRLTALVEEYGGRVGGGVTGTHPESAEDDTETRYVAREWIRLERPAPELDEKELVSAVEVSKLAGTTHVAVILAAERDHWVQVIDRHEPNPRRARRFLRKQAMAFVAEAQNRGRKNDSARAKPTTRGKEQRQSVSAKAAARDR